MENSYIKTKPKMVITVSSIVTIHYNEYGPNFFFPGESHDFWEMVYVDKGRVQVTRDGESLTLRQGEILFHKPNEFHTIRSFDSSPNFFVISFASPSAAMNRFEKHRALLDRTLNSYLSAILDEAEKTYHTPKNDPDLKQLERRSNAPLGSEQLIKTYLEQLLIFLLRSMADHKASPSFPTKKTDLDPLVESIIVYLRQNVNQAIRVEDLCKTFDYSRSYLSRHFQEKTGQTLAHYFASLKVSEAKRLMRETTMNFAQIATRLAFESPQYFSRVFKRHTGLTPSEFKRKAHR